MVGKKEDRLRDKINLRRSLSIGLFVLWLIIVSASISVATDNDGDGYNLSDSNSSFIDCNDNDSSIYPGATETCNNLDDNCDGNIDEGVVNSTTCGVGVCSGNSGIQACVNGTWGNDTCNPLNRSTAETCNNEDDDCDGEVDEGLNQNSTCGVGICLGSVGIQTCTNGILSDTCDAFSNATAEIVNNLDDDCDGEVDEGISRTTTCGVGICSGNTGIEIYSNGTYSNGTYSNGTWVNDTCDPFFNSTAETCNNLDDDCDGEIDENLTQSTTCGVGRCSGNTGMQTCTNGVWGGDTCDSFSRATTEICNNLDDDCDGNIDNGVVNTTICENGTGFGTQICANGLWGEDTCNSLQLAANETTPLILRNSRAQYPVTFEVHNQSMWENGNPPAENSLEILPRQYLNGNAGFDKSATFRLPYASDVIESIVKYFKSNTHTSVTVGGNLQAGSSGHIGVRTKLSDFQGGTVDINYPEKITLMHPSANTFRPGDTLRLTTNSKPSNGAYLHSSPSAVDFSLILDLVVKETLGGKIDYGSSSKDLGTSNIIDINEDNITILHLNEHEGWYSDKLKYPPPSLVSCDTPFNKTEGGIFWEDQNVPTIVDVCNTVDCIKFLTGATGYIEMPFPKPETEGVNQNGNLVARDTNTFGNANINLNKATKYGKLLAIEIGNISGFELTEKTLDADIFLKSKIKQDLEFSPENYIRFDFSSPVIYNGAETNSITTLVRITGSVATPIEPLNIEFPPNKTDSIKVIPTVIFHNTFHNKYVHKDNNIFSVEAGTYLVKIPGVTLLSRTYSIPNIFDTHWVCTDETCWGDRCICDWGYFEFGSIDVGPYTTPSYNAGPVGPAYKTTPSYDVSKKVVDQTFELGGFNNIELPSFDLDPQVKPTPVIIPKGQDPYSVDEGSNIVLDGSESYDSDGDPIRLFWDLDNDGVFEIRGSKVNYLGSDDGNYTVNLMANDPYGFATAETNVIVENVIPVVDAGSDQTADEGDLVEISSTFSDAGWLDTHNATIDWGDETEVQSGTLIEENGYPNSTGTVTGNHTYGDNGVYTVTVTVTDDDNGVGTDTLTITVENVIPVVDAGENQIANEGDLVEISSTFSDAGWLDTHMANIDWGDETEVQSGTLIEENGYPNSTGTVTGNHTYGDNGVYTVTVTVTDDDNGVGTDNLTITVNNVAPTVNIISMAQPNPQFILPIVHELIFDGNFTDPGWLDTHSVTWNFGDGTVMQDAVIEENEYPYATGNTTVKHIYSEPGTYVVTLNITDDDNGVGTDTMSVIVVDAKGANQDLSNYIQGLDDNDFKKNANQRKKALANMLKTVDYLLNKKVYQGAILDLRYNVRSKADGLVDGNSKNDWIIDQEAQQHICMKIDDLTAYLEYLKQQHNKPWYSNIVDWLAFWK